MISSPTAKEFMKLETVKKWLEDMQVLID